MKKQNKQFGFTVLELLLSIAVIAVLSAATIGYYRGSIMEVSAESTIKTFVADLNSARGRAMAGDRGMSWGVRAIPKTAGLPDRWEFFGTSTSSVVPEPFVAEVKTLPTSLIWIDPSSSPKEVLFLPLKGTTSSTIFILGFDKNQFKINVSDMGEITVVRS